MRHISAVPCGTPAVTQRQNDDLRPTGWRKPIEVTADTSSDSDIPKGRAIVALKRVATHIGLRPAQILLLDTLCAFSQPQDWQSGARPVVWPSNALLMEQTGYSLSALKRHLRRLGELGIVSFADSPNGKRWGHRDETGRIREAYGINLTPLQNRAATFEELAQNLMAKRAEKTRIKRQITILRRQCREILRSAHAGIEPHHELESLLVQQSQSRDCIQTLKGILEKFEILFSSLQTRTENLPTHKEMDPIETKSDPHIQPTKKTQKLSNNLKSDTDVPFDTVTAACPTLQAWGNDTNEPMKTKEDILRASNRWYRMIGITDKSWRLAQTALGPMRAALSFAILFEKTTQKQVQRPDRYLLGMLKKADEGALNLHRSLYGMAAHQRQIS